jgi:hypothetical protein
VQPADRNRWVALGEGDPRPPRTDRHLGDRRWRLKTRRYRLRVDGLGGVDVLALDGLDDTVSPANALEIGIPVGRLADEHASPLTWTELLLERLSS